VTYLTRRTGAVEFFLWPIERRRGSIPRPTPGGRHAFLDPNDPANAGTINANIRHSFRAFGDEDHDGVDDDHEAGGGR